MKKFASVLLAFVLLFEALPVLALADAVNYTLPEEDMNRIIRRAGINGAAYHTGMEFSPNMSGYQMLSWLYDFQENEIAALVNSWQSLIDEVGDDPEYQDQINMMRDAADFVPQEMNRYAFDMDNALQTIETQYMILSAEDSTTREKSTAARDLEAAGNKLEKMMDDLVPLYSAVIKSIEETREELRKWHEEHKAGDRLLSASAGENAATPVVVDSGKVLYAAGMSDTRDSDNIGFNFQILEKNQIGIQLLDASSQPIQNAKVRLSDGKQTRTAISNAFGNVSFDAGIFDMDSRNTMLADLYIECKGYRTIEGQGISVRAGSAWILTLETDNGQSYLQSLNFRGTDILHQSEEIYATPYNDATQKLIAKVHTKPNSDLKITMEYNDRKTTKRVAYVKTVHGGQDGVAEVDMSNVWCSMLSPGTNVEFRTETSGAAPEVRVFKALINVKKAVVDQPLYSMSALGPAVWPQISSPLPLDLPGMALTAIACNLKAFKNVKPTVVITPEGDFTLGVAYTRTLKAVDETKQSWKTNNKEYLESQRHRWMGDVASLKELAMENMVTGGQPFKPLDYFTTKPALLLTAVLSGQVYENPFPTSEDDMYKGKLSLFLSAGVTETFSWQHPYTIGPVPVFLGFDFTIGITVGVDLNLAFKTSSRNTLAFSQWHDFEFNREAQDIIVAPSFRISVYAGVGVRKVLALYIRGTAGLVLTFHFRPFNPNNKIKLVTSLSLSLDACVEFLFFSYSKTIVSKKWSWDTDLYGSSGKDSAAPVLLSDTDLNAPDPVQYSSIDVQPLPDIPARKERGFQSCVTNNDPRIFYASLDWFDEALRSKSHQAYLRYYDPRTNEFGALDKPVDIAIYPEACWNSEVVPEDVYTVSYEMIGNSENFDIEILVWFARHKEDKPDGTPTWVRPQIITIHEKEAFTRVLQKGSESAHGKERLRLLRDCIYAVPEFVTLGTSHNSGSFYDGAICYTEQYAEDEYYHAGKKMIFHGALVSPLTVNYSELNRLQSSEVRTDRELRQIIASPYGPYGYEVVVLYGPSENDPNDLLEYTYSYSYGGITNTYYHKEFSEKIASVAHVDTTTQQALNHGPSLYMITKRDDSGNGLVTPELQIMYPTIGEYIITDSMIIGPRIQMGHQISDAPYCVVSTGNVSTLYYLAKESEAGRTRYAIKAIYIASAGSNQTFISHPFHLGVFDADDFGEDGGIRSISFFPQRNGFLHGIVQADHSAPGADEAEFSYYYFTLKQTIQLDLQGCALDHSLVTPGENINLTFRVMNTGNVPVSAFDLAVQAVDAKGAKYKLSDIHVACANPQDSQVVNYSNGTDRVVYGESAVTDYDDPMDRDRNYWEVTDSSGNVTAYTTSTLMPEETHFYRSTFNVPNNFKGGDYQVYLTIRSMSVDAVRSADGMLNATDVWARSLKPIREEKDSQLYKNADASLALANDPIYTITATVTEPDQSVFRMKNDTSTASSDTVPVRLSVDIPGDGMLPSGAGAGDSAAELIDPLAAFANETVPSSRELTMDSADLSITAQYALAGTEKIAHIVVENNSATSMSNLRLTASVDGKECFVYAFDPAFELDHTQVCSLDIPVQKLTGGIKGAYLSLNISGNGKDIILENNTAQLFLRVPFRIITQPQDQTVTEGSKAGFEVMLAGGELPYRYQWQVSDRRNGNWTDLKGENSNTLQLSAVKQKQSGTLYRCVVWDGEGQQLISDAALLLVIKIPRTGDTATPVVWLSLMFAGMLMSMLLVKKRRKRN